MEKKKIALWFIIKQPDERVCNGTRTRMTGYRMREGGVRGKHMDTHGKGYFLWECGWNLLWLMDGKRSCYLCFEGGINLVDCKHYDAIAYD